MRVAIALLLSALTLVGGHFFNRRWDRAVLVFGIAVVWTVGFYPLYFYLLSRLGGNASPDALKVTMYSIYHYYFAGLAVLWVSSLLVSGWDARKGKTPFIQRWTISGIIGASLMVVTMGGLGAYQALNYTTLRSVETSKVGYKGSKSSTRSGFFSSNFLHHINFGGFNYEINKPGEPPKGEGVLRVSFSYLRKPAVGVRFKLDLNGEYETESLTTNDEGYADVSLPPGIWTINVLRTSEWEKHRGDEGMVLFTGHESHLAAGNYEAHPWFNSKGIALKVGKGDAMGTFHVEIRPQIEMVWPTQDSKADQASIDSDSIQWQPAEGAEKYLLKITRLERDGNSTAFHPVTSRVVTGTTKLPLSELQSVSSEGPAEEYQVEIFGFDAKGQFVNSIEGSYRTASFLLSDKHVLVEEKAAQEITGGVTPATYKRYRKDRKRLEAVELLIGEDMLGAAEKLLAEVDPNSKPVLQKALRGYLLAKRGDCKAAEPLFSEAELDENCRCKVKQFRKVCSNPKL